MAHRAFTLIPLALAATLAASLAAGTGTTKLYRTVDANGVVQYSDRPSPGAQTLEIGSAPGPTSSSAPQRFAPPAGTGSARPAADRSASYSACEIAEPQNDATIVNEESVAVSLRLEPALQPGHRSYLLYDGARVDGTGTSFTLAPVYRGTHTLIAVVQDGQGKTLCRSSAITFNVRQPTVAQPLGTSPPHH